MGDCLRSKQLRKQLEQTLYPALPQREGRFYNVYAENGRAGGLTFSIERSELSLIG